MKKPVYTDLSLSLPILVISYGQTSNDLEKIVKLLSDQCGVTECTNVTGISDLCNQRRISLPERMRIQFIPCINQKDYFEMSKLLLLGQNQLFHQSFGTLVIIDYSVNNNIRILRESFGKEYPELKNYGFVYYNATEELIPFHSHDTHLSFNTYKVETVISHIKQFCSFAFNGIMNSPLFVDYLSLLTRKSVRGIYVSTFFMLISVDSYDIVQILFSYLKNAEVFNNSKVFCSIYEIMGLIEQLEPGILRRKKLYEKIPTLIAPWPIEEVAFDDASFAYSVAAAYAFKAKIYYKVVDLGLRIFALGKHHMINHLFSLIEKHASKPDLMALRALNLIELCSRMKLESKASFFAFRFSQIFEQDYRLVFLMESLQLMQQSGRGLLVYELLQTPLMLSIANECSFDPKELGSSLYNFLALIGKNLSDDIQKMLFLRLSEIEGVSGYNGSPLVSITNADPLPSTCSIREVFDKKSPSKSSSCVFLYNALSGCDSQAIIRSFCNKNDVFRFVVDVYNPFTCSIPCILSIPEQPCLKSDRRSVQLIPKSKTTITLSAIPTEEQVFSILSINCLIYGALSQVSLPKELSFHAIDGAPNFFVRTGLTQIPRYIGECVMFPIWIGNKSREPISKLSIEYPKCATFSHSSFTLPLPKGREQITQCLFYASPFNVPSSINIVCSAKNNRVESFYEIPINFQMKKSITIDSIGVIRTNSELFEPFPDYIFLSLSIRNDSQSTFTLTGMFQTEVEFPSPILSTNPRSCILSSNSAYVFILPILRKEIISSSMIAIPHRIVTAASIYEEVKRRKLTKEERFIVTKLVKMVQYIEKRLDISWISEDGRSGKVCDIICLPDESIFEQAKVTRIYPIIKARNFDQHAVYASEIIVLDISFGQTIIDWCSIDLGRLSDSKYGVMWDGSLLQMKSSSFEFKFCFSIPGTYDLTIKYQSGNGDNGFRVYTIHVVEYSD